MATLFTHALVGGALSSVSPPRSHPLRLGLVLAGLAVLPDLDVVAFRLGIPYDHPLGHRGFTHSFAFAALVGALATAIFFPGLGLGSRAWWRIALLAAVATASHGILDAFTDAGLGVGFLLPFDDRRFFFPVRPLATSPLGVRAFLDGPALAILGNEVLWIWLPLGLLLGLRRLQRRAGKRRASDATEPARPQRQ